MGVDIKNVVDVPNETIASDGFNGSARIVDGLSPVEGIMVQSGLNEYRSTKYLWILPRCRPPSSGTSPSFCFRSSTPNSPAHNLRRRSSHDPSLMFHRFIPQTSEISKGAMLPKNSDARNDDTSEIRDVFLYCSGYLR